ncbi:DinB family protein [Lacihabitans sp. CS3-21]|uniref:DinB family protein n=1 Tax=Lacihabitans sp. CS3-21 TaxID=2487332 RepID=UPI0020CF2BF1|nr:DinB family protein [Lacihabitans sp. CS3-21]MCP9749263.1 DinB family protein [Lacihabitans sp. CS3-21]
MTNKSFIVKLDKSTQDFLQILKGCSSDCVHFKNDNQWNILEIIEHIYLTDRVIYTIISGASETRNSSLEIIGDENLQKILVTNWKEKIKSPDILIPKGEITNMATLVSLLVNQRELWKDDVSKGKICIDNRIFVHPFLGKMTVIDWVNFAIHHTQRHIQQIEGIINGYSSR